jgi:ribosomal protein S18 acetylase RimI-like enzyme
MTAQIRVAVDADLPAVLELWQLAAAEPTHTDDLDGLRTLFTHDQGSLLVADTEGQLVGSVIAAWDGWRGSIYRLVVLPNERRRGLGRQLLSAAQGRLESSGARRLQAIVVEFDDRAIRFWRASTWEEQSERRRFVLG